MPDAGCEGVLGREGSVWGVAGDAVPAAGVVQGLEVVEPCALGFAPQVAKRPPGCWSDSPY